MERNQRYYKEVIDLAGMTAPETLVSAMDIAAITAQAQREVSNLTRSMGFLVDSGRTMLTPARAYQWALDNAEMQVMSGAVSYNQAIRNTVKQLADSGIKIVAYESGQPGPNRRSSPPSSDDGRLPALCQIHGAECGILRNAIF